MKITVDIESEYETSSEFIQIGLKRYYNDNMNIKVTEHYCKLTEEQARKMLKEITWRWDGVLFAATIERWKLKGFITEATNENEDNY